MRQVDLTIVLTTYRRSEMLLRSLNSVLAQVDFQSTTRVQVIVSDDCPDGWQKSFGIMSAAFDLTSVELVYVKRSAGQAGGVAESRNRAISIASGEWVLFLDDDDELEAGALSVLGTVLQSCRCDFIYGGFSVWMKMQSGEVRMIESCNRTNISYVHLLISNFHPIGSFLIRRSVIKLLFDPLMESHEDWLFLLDNLSGLKVLAIPDQLVRIHRSSNSADHRNERGGVNRKRLDFCEIYKRHPAPQFEELRQRMLSQFADRP